MNSPAVEQLSKQKPPYALVFDTSTAKGGVALLRQNTVLNRLVWSREASHGEFLTPAIQRTLEESQVTLHELDHIAVGYGPGSFTGVRVAVNAARALSYALNGKGKIFAYDTTEILAAGVGQTDLPVAVLMNAQKNHLFFSTFQFSNSTWMRSSSLRLVPIEEVEKTIQTPHYCVGDGYTDFNKFFSARLRSMLIRSPTFSDYPTPETLGQLDFMIGSTRQALVWKDLQALYLRPSGAEEKLEESRRSSTS